MSTLDNSKFVPYTNTMAGGIFADAAGMGIEALARRDPKVKGSIPTVEDLEAEFHRIYDKEPVEGAQPELSQTEPQETKVSKGTACLPCVNDHFSTCAGLVSDEAIRFARREGVESNEVTGRLMRCADQLNGMEREDLRQENIDQLPPWEKDLAIYAQNQGAAIRHKINEMKTLDDLEDLAIMIRETRESLGKAWVKGRLASMSPEERERVKAKAQELIEKRLEEPQP